MTIPLLLSSTSKEMGDNVTMRWVFLDITHAHTTNIAAKNSTDFYEIKQASMNMTTTNF